MADYIYLLETRLTPAQLKALNRVRELARAHGTTVFLVGGAVRDLTAGFSVRDLDFAFQADPTSFKKEFQKEGFTVTGEHSQTQSLFLTYPGGVRLEVGATLSATFPKPGKPAFAPANILDDLRRRDFTANAMAISLNEGSFGLLMDPLNGVADIENMELRLVSNYGFIEDPVRMIRAARLSSRMGWHLEEKTQGRYETGKQEDYIATMSAWQRGYETEEIFHEEDPLRVLRRLEAEGWSKFLFPAWTSAKANETELNKLRDVAGQLNGAGIFPDPSAAYFPLLTAKLAPKEVAELKKSFARPGFVAAIDALEGQTKTFGGEFSGKAAATPSAAWRMLYTAVPEQVLALAYSSKSAPVQARFKAFFSDWPQARARIPYQAMQEMRITPDLPVYNELLDKLFFALMDGLLETPEAIKAFLEPYSPPAPPPPVTLRRRPVKRETKATKKKAGKAETAPADEAAALPSVAATAPATPAAPAPAKAAEKKAAAPAVKQVAAKQPATKLASPKAAHAKAVAAVKKAVAKAPAEAAKKAAPPARKPAPPAKKASQKSASRAGSANAKKSAPAKPAAKKPVKKVAPPKKQAARPAAKAKNAAKKPAVAKKPAGKKKPAAKPAKSGARKR